MKINIKLLHEKARLPKKGSEGASRYDIYCFDYYLDCHTDIIIFRTGLAFEIPHGYEMTLVPRSSTNKKWGLRLANQTGVIDSDYRGEVLAMFKVDNNCFYDREDYEGYLIQAKIEKASVDCDWCVVDELSATARGSGGFGSTGE